MREPVESRREFLRQAIAIGLTAALPAGCAYRDALRPDKATAPGAEIRAIWLSLSSPRDLFCEDDQPGGTPTPAGVRRVVELTAGGGFNTIFLMVDTWYGYSLLHPEYLPVNPLAAFDAVAELLAAAREHLIQVHLSFGIVNKRNNPRLPGIAPDFVTAAGGDPRWHAWYANDDGTRVESPDNVCVVREETREWEAGLCADLVARYPEVRCFQFEEPGYDTRRFCVCDECCRVYRSRYDQDLVAQVLREAALDGCSQGNCDRRAALFKSANTSTTIDAIRTRVAARRLTYSATISPDWWVDERLGRDWKRWTGEGWLGFVAPMIYVPGTDSFRQALEQRLLPDLDPRRPICAGIGVHYSGFLNPLPSQPPARVNSLEEVIQQIDAAREIGKRQDDRVCGVALFFGQLLRPADRQLGVEYLDGLGGGPFKRRASLPRWLPDRPPTF